MLVYNMKISIFLVDPDPKDIYQTILLPIFFGKQHLTNCNIKKL